MAENCDPARCEMLAHNFSRFAQFANLSAILTNRVTPRYVWWLYNDDRGQMEGPKVSIDSREAQSAGRRRSAEGVRFGRDAVVPPHKGSVDYAPDKFSKINYEIACFLHFLCRR